MLLEIILPLETFPADLAAESQLGTLVRPLVYHEVVALGESALAVLADELALWTHLPPELPAAVIILYVHYRKHGCFFLSVLLPYLKEKKRNTHTPVLLKIYRTGR